MWPIVRKYYVGLFIGFLVMCTIISVVRKSHNNFAENAVIIVAASFFASLVCGTLFYLQDTRWGPRKREKRLLKSPFKELFENGFTRKGNLAVGMVNGYTMVIMYIWDGGKPAIKVDALFDLGISTDPDTENMIREISKRNKPSNAVFDQPYAWTKNSIGYRLEYSFSPPSYKEVVKKVEKLTEVLIRERLRTMSLEEAIRLQGPV
jgi:hypothetical protein